MNYSTPHTPPSADRPGLQAELIQLDADAMDACTRDNTILGALAYTQSTPASNADNVSARLPFPCVDVPMLAGDITVAEVWKSNSSVSYSVIDDWHLAQNQNYLLATLSYADNNHSLTELAQLHYANLFKLLEQTGYSQLLRIWNYVPGINDKDANGQERYRSFCLGRSLAFANFFADSETCMPAATGIGSHAATTAVVVIAQKPQTGVTHLENPQQTPAYRYPTQYGPRAPSFARGTSHICSSTGQHLVFVSGTASIIGSKTVNKGDITRQLDTTLDNISTLLSRKNLALHALSTGFQLSDMQAVKVYYRKSADLPEIKKSCKRAFVSPQYIVYLRADICREDLDVEIEGHVALRR